jgi:hypothetical protein
VGNGEQGNWRGQEERLGSRQKIQPQLVAQGRSQGRASRGSLTRPQDHLYPASPERRVTQEYRAGTESERPEPHKQQSAQIWRNPQEELAAVTRAG